MMEQPSVDYEKLRGILMSLGYSRETGTMMERWSLKEGPLRFGAVLGATGLGKEGLFLNAQCRTERSFYDSEGVSFGISLSDLVCPSGYLGPNPSIQEVLERMEHLRDQAGHPDPVWRKLREAVSNSDASLLAETVHGISSELIARRYGYERRTLLHDARTPEIAKILIGAGISVEARDRSGDTPLHFANVPEVVRILLAAGACVEAQDSSGNTPLHVADDPEIVRVLLAAGACVESANSMHATPLHRAVSGSRLPVVLCLLEHGASPAARDDNGSTPLHIVSDPQICSALIRNGAPVGACDEQGATPLHTAASRDVALLLLLQGAELEAIDHEGRTPLCRAIERDNLDVAEIIRQWGGDVRRLGLRGATMLNSAQSAKAVRWLVQQGVDPGAQDALGRNPIHDCQNTRVIRALVDEGADVNGRDHGGRTPLHKAQGANIVKTLLSLGADPLLTDAAGLLPGDTPRNKKAELLLREAMSRLAL